MTTKAKFDPAKVKIVKNVTLPTLKKEDDVPMYITITSPIVLGKQMPDEKQKDGSMKTPDRCHLSECINLETGEEMQVIHNAVMRSNLEESYKDASYVGKSFKIVQMKVAGKRYKNFSIIEIEA